MPSPMPPVCRAILMTLSGILKSGITCPGLPYPQTSLELTPFFCRPPFRRDTLPKGSPADLHGTILLARRDLRLKWKMNSKLGDRRPFQSPMSPHPWSHTYHPNALQETDRIHSSQPAQYCRNSPSRCTNPRLTNTCPPSAIGRLANTPFIRASQSETPVLYSRC